MHSARAGGRARRGRRRSTNPRPGLKPLKRKGKRGSGEFRRAYDLASGGELWSFPGLTDEPITTPFTGEGLVFATSYNLKTNEDAMPLWSYDRVLEEHDADGDGAIDR